MATQYKKCFDLLGLETTYSSQISFIFTRFYIDKPFDMRLFRGSI